MATESPRPFVLPVGVGRTAAPGALAPSSVRVPTGVPDFDYLTGGLPAGSVVLLFGSAGAGHQEFAFTSAVRLMGRVEDPSMHRVFLGRAKGTFAYPESVAYLSTSRSRDQILGEVRAAFDGTYPGLFEEHLEFLDLSPAYFADTVVPASWSSQPNRLLSGAAVVNLPSDGPLRAVAEAIDGLDANQLVILDSLTDLLVRRGVEAPDLLALLKGLRRHAKEWGGLVYLVLTEGVAPPPVEQAVLDSVDGVLHFSWVASPSHSHRQRAMLIEKFLPVLARLPAEYLGRFVIQVSARSGLVTTQYERV